MATLGWLTNIVIVLQIWVSYDQEIYFNLTIIIKLIEPERRLPTSRAKQATHTYMRADSDLSAFRHEWQGQTSWRDNVTVYYCNNNEFFVAKVQLELTFCLFYVVMLCDQSLFVSSSNKQYSMIAISKKYISGVGIFIFVVLYKNVAMFI